jgi:Family of unknown function (DUF5677)
MSQKKAKPAKKRSPLTSSLDQHKRLGKSLVPPLLTVPGVTFQSWTNDRLPEMLWACLVISVLPRSHALNAFREIASIGLKYRDRQGTGEWSLFQSQLPLQPPEIFNQILAVITRHPLGYAALRPLLLFDGLPGRDQWMSALTVEVQEGDWQTLGDAVLKVLDHHSQEATDVRWLSVLFKIALGLLYLPVGMKDHGEEILHYPNRGDMRSVRPSIRAMEMSLAMGSKPEKTVWSTTFWKECLDKTRCAPVGLPRQTGPAYDRIASIKQIWQVHEALLNHWFTTLDTTAIDAKHDAAFGFGFYSLAVLLEMIVGRNGSGITGRLLLRTLVECRISLAYLRSSCQADLWDKFRAFGSGQAKLALLKLDEMGKNKPNFVSARVLESLCNEDFFQEYLQMDLGHWCGLDLGKMAEASGTKADYDAVYGWASTFVHGHWPALRDSCMTHCLNPLHRLHRVPLPGHRLLENSVPDGVRLVNLIVDDVAALYPAFIPRVQVVHPENAPEANGAPSPKPA